MVSLPDRGIRRPRRCPVMWPAPALRAVGLAIALVGCHDGRGDAPTAPTLPQPTLGGRWLGVVSNPLTGVGRLSLTIDERPVSATSSALLGTWSIAFETGVGNAEGTISGVLASSTADINLFPAPRPTCSPAVLPFSIASSSFALRVETSPVLMKGTATYFTCTQASDGTVELSRQ